MTTAVELQDAFPQCRVTILAAQLAEDLKNTRYTSSWAGAHHVTLLGPGQQRDFEVATFKRLWAMAHTEDDDPAPLLVAPQTEVFEDANRQRFMLSNLADFMPNLREMDPSELPEGCAAGLHFETVCIDTPAYLSWLSRRLKARGAVFVRQDLAHMNDAPLHDHDIIVNCTGLGSLQLGGVDDTTMYPVRGQTVLVRAPWLRQGITRTADNVWTYIIPRKSQGHVIVGGTRQKDDWNGKPDPATADAILRRAIKLCPELLPEDKRANGDIADVDVVEHGCGLRPARKDGIRVELEHYEDKETAEGERVRRWPLLHNYGHAGAGYQSSWGSAAAAVALLQRQLSARVSSSA